MTRRKYSNEALHCSTVCIIQVTVGIGLLVLPQMDLLFTCDVEGIERVMFKFCRFISGVFVNVFLSFRFSILSAPVVAQLVRRLANFRLSRLRKYLFSLLEVLSMCCVFYARSLSLLRSCCLPVLIFVQNERIQQ